MRFYHREHMYYCGVDLHARTMYIWILNQTGETVFHHNIRSCPEAFLKVIEPFREDICVAAECTFTWYWLADLCAEENIHFVLGHALYMKAINGAKTKSDKLDAEKIARILRGGTFPIAYVYPRKMRSTRDILRRRMHLTNKRSELLVHIENTNSQYNLDKFPKKLTYKSNREGVASRFEDSSACKTIEVDLHLLDCYDKLLRDLELYIVRTARCHDADTLHLLKTVPGIGKILSLVLLYEIHDINRFPSVQDFASYSRLIKPPRESAGKKYGSSNTKIGNVHLKWAFSEIACLFLKGNDRGQKHHNRLVSKHGKSKALSILSHELGRSIYFMLKRREPFDMDKFFNQR
ncbi:MAG: IS110 family transposase [Chloroflexi bacterium]|nr:IS110 family transposase [Chloroflexota bacterium]